LFICIVLPIKADITTNGKTTIFIWKMIKYTGASFCQVINSVLFLRLIFFTMFTNHLWNGEEAILIINAITIKFPRFNPLLDHIFLIIPLLISSAEDKD
jgi:hypothetical protein